MPSLDGREGGLTGAVYRQSGCLRVPCTLQAPERSPDVTRRGRFAIHVRVRLRVLIPLLLLACAAAPTSTPVAATVEVPDGGDAGAPDAGGDDATAGGDGDAGDAAASLAVADAAAAPKGPCPPEMVLVEGAFCIDRWEASLIETKDDGTEAPYPHWLPVGDDNDVRAVSQAGAIPQGYMSAESARDACAASDKRLCALREWKTACMGTQKTAYPYGATRTVGRCNDNGRSPIGVVFPNANMTPPPALAHGGGKGKPGAKTAAKGATKGGATVKGKRVKGKAKAVLKKPVRPRPGQPAPKKKGGKHAHALPPGIDYSVWTKLNDPRLGQVSGSWTPTGERAECRSDYGTYDMVGNRHEWVSDETASGNGIFAGGYFLDTTQNGEGCNYRTEAHATSYHDYSIGFRCCKDPEAPDAAPVTPAVTAAPKP